MDSTDIKLCMFLLVNSRTPYHELAGRLGLSINAVHKRIRALLDLGVIRAFRARPSLNAVGAVTVWVYGRSGADRPSEVYKRLKENESTYWVAISGGGYLYVGGYLKDLSELDTYVSFVKKEGGISDPTVGIQPSGRPQRAQLQLLDYQILAALGKDSRKAATLVAREVRASAKTVHNRLERMEENGLVDFSLDWYPDASNDIISVCHIDVSGGTSRTAVLSSLRQRIHENILVEIMFANLPNQLTLFLWTNTMRQMDGLRELISGESGVVSVTMNVLQIGYMFDTWRDKLLTRSGDSAN